MEKGPFHLPHWAVILLLFFVPPIAWWHMWKNHRYHTWFPYVLWLNAAITFGFSTYVIVNFYPLLTRFVDSKTFIFTSHIGLLLLAVFEIVFGFYLIKMFKNETMLKRKILAIVIVLLFINTIAIPISQLFIASTIQSRFEKNPAVTSTNQKETSTVHPDEIGANWKTYTNNKFAYSLQYPPDAVLYEGKQASADGQYSSAPNSIQLQLSDGLFTIAVSDHIDDIAEFGTPNVFYSDVKRKKITFKGLEAYELLETTFGLYGTEEIGVQKNTLYYLFRGEPSFNETTDQILSTFRFDGD